MKNHRGFTIVEVLIAMAVGVVIIGAVYAAVTLGLKTTTGIRGKISATQDARQALEIMSLEIQMASFNPTYAGPIDQIWQNATCSAASSAEQFYKGIQGATATTLVVQEDINGNGVVGGTGNPNEIITYTYDQANQRITRETNCGGAQPFLGDMATSATPRTARVINTAAIPVFRYFNAGGDELTVANVDATLRLPNRTRDITRIDITLWVETEDVAQDIKQRRTMIYSNTVIPRNHVIIN